MASKNIALCLLMSLSLNGVGAGVSAAPEGQAPAIAGQTAPTRAALEECRNESEANPGDAGIKFKYAELLRAAGQNEEACQAYLQVTEIDASNYVAYHWLSQICDDQGQLSEAVSRLEYLMQTKPKDLLLRVALSELLERQGNYYRASRPLIDLIFADGVPPAYAKKVNDRIRFLQARAKEVQVKRKASEIKLGHNEVDLPLPGESLEKGLYATRPDDSGSDSEFGNTRLHH